MRDEKLSFFFSISFLNVVDRHITEDEDEDEDGAIKDTFTLSRDRRNGRQGAR